jgi:SAM-dependent methyltransferase
VASIAPDLKNLVARVALDYPRESLQYALSEIERTAFHIEIVSKKKGTNIAICDVGGSINLFSVACAALGMKSTVVDKFDLGYEDILNSVHRSYGVHVIKCDVVTESLSLPPASIDVATSFDSIEHWHGSPKPTLQALRSAIKPGGIFFIGVPNCVNLRKRITVPFGYGKWCSTEDWYETPVFRSHVHEPDVDDLRYIAKDLGLKNVAIFGRNWAGYASGNKLVRLATRVFDPVLQLRPSLCSDIYLLGEI